MPLRREHPSLMSDLFSSLVTYLFLPSNTGEMSVCYFVWISFFLIVNVAWDIKSRRTPTFHLDRFKDKGDVLFSASAFCSSILILGGLLSPRVQELAKDTTVPLILAGFSGLVRAIPALCPYKSTDNIPEV
jgi:hypothetical protein